MTTTLQLNGVIGLDIVGDAFASALQNIDEALILEVNSEGGFVGDGITIFNAIKNHPHNVTVRIVGSAMSTATWMIAAANFVEMNEVGLIALHDPAPLASSPDSIEDLEQLVTNLKATKEVILTAFSARTGLKPDKVQDMMTKKTFLSANDAEKFGFVDKVIKLKTKTRLAGRNLAPPAFANYFIQGETKMDSYIDLAKELGYKATEENAKDVIVNAFNLLKKKTEPIKTIEVPEKFLNMAVKSRNDEIEKLVNSFRISKVVGDELKNKYANKDSTLEFLTTEGDDEFSTLINILEKNEPRIEPKEKTALQKDQPAHLTSDGKTVLEAQMEKLANRYNS